MHICGGEMERPADIAIDHPSECRRTGSESEILPPDLTLHYSVGEDCPARRLALCLWLQELVHVFDIPLEDGPVQAYDVSKHRNTILDEANSPNVVKALKSADEKFAVHRSDAEPRDGGSWLHDFETATESEMAGTKRCIAGLERYVCDLTCIVDSTTEEPAIEDIADAQDKLEVASRSLLELRNSLETKKVTMLQRRLESERERTHAAEQDSASERLRLEAEIEALGKKNLSLEEKTRLQAATIAQAEKASATYLHRLMLEKARIDADIAEFGQQLPQLDQIPG